MLRALKKFALGAIPSATAGKLRAWRVQRLIDTYRTRVVQHTYGRVPLKVCLTDPMSAGWYDHDWVELPEIAALRGTALRDGAIVFDIGAHQGVVALMLAAEVGATGSVVAVEPSTHNTDTARRNAELNGVTQVIFVEAAIADREGSITFNRGLNGQLDDGSGSAGRVEVRSVTLDALAETFGSPDLVFLDVEGAECLALRAGAGVLATAATFCVEVHVGCGLELLGGSVRELLGFFPVERYRLRIRADADGNFQELTSADHLLSHRFFLLATRRVSETRR